MRKFCIFIRGIYALLTYLKVYKNLWNFRQKFPKYKHQMKMIDTNYPKRIDNE